MFLAIYLLLPLRVSIKHENIDKLSAIENIFDFCFYVLQIYTFFWKRFFCHVEIYEN